MRLFWNLPCDFSKADLSGLFALYGTITSVEIPVDPVTRRPLGFGLVAFYYRKDARRAARELDGLLVAGRMIRVRRGRRKRRSF